MYTSSLMIKRSLSIAMSTTVVDAMGNGFRPIVPRECVGDRAEGPHEANLFDMDQKYADVLSSEAVINYLEALPPQKGDVS